MCLYFSLSTRSIRSASNLMKAFHQGDWVHCKEFCRDGLHMAGMLLLIEKRLRHAHMPGGHNICCLSVRLLLWPSKQASLEGSSGPQVCLAGLM